MRIGEHKPDRTFQRTVSTFENIRTDSNIKYHLYIISVLVNLSYELESKMSKYDFQEARQVILSNIRTDSILT